jgi:hypothetical protein
MKEAARKVGNQNVCPALRLESANLLRIRNSIRAKLELLMDIAAQRSIAYLPESGVA